jgi:hypothetical protein
MSDWALRRFAAAAETSGDAALALGYLLCAEDGDSCTDTLDARLAHTEEYAASRATLLLAVAVHALRGHAASSGDRAKNQQQEPHPTGTSCSGEEATGAAKSAAESAEALRRWLRSPLTAIVRGLPQAAASGEAAAPESGEVGRAVGKVRRYQQMLGMSTDTQLLKRHLPQVDVGRFVSGDETYRRQIILCLASLLDAPGPAAVVGTDKHRKQQQASEEPPSPPATLSHAVALAAR